MIPAHKSLSMEEIRAQGASGKILGLDPPLALDDFQLYYPDGEFESIPLNAVRAHGIWEPEVTRFVIQTACMETPESQGIMLDVGAHLGYFGCIASKASGGAMEVHMFEPNTAMCQSIQDTIDYGKFPRDKFHIHNNAVAAESGINVHLAGPEKDSGSSTMVTGDQEGPNGTFDPTQFSVGFDSTTLRIDDLGLDHVRLVKMDIEGYEYEAWKGMRETIQRSPQMIVVLETGAYHPKEFHKEIREEFDVYVFDWDGSLAPEPEGYLEIVPSTNAILRKK